MATIEGSFQRDEHSWAWGRNRDFFPRKVEVVLHSEGIRSVAVFSSREWGSAPIVLQLSLENYRVLLSTLHEGLNLVEIP